MQLIQKIISEMLSEYEKYAHNLSPKDKIEEQKQDLIEFYKNIDKSWEEFLKEVRKIKRKGYVETQP